MGPILMLVWAGCSSDVEIDGPPASPPIPLALTVDQPVYGAYVGDRAVVSGAVTDPGAAVWIEGYRANVGPTGRFQVEVPIPGDFRVIDVEAIRPPSTSAGGGAGGDGDHLRERRPVFSGADPLASWPGGMSLRITPVALDHVSELIAAQVDALDLPGQLAGLVPSLTVGTWSLQQTGLSAGASTVTLVPSRDGLALTVSLGRVEVGYDLVTDNATIGTVPVTLGLDQITFAAGLSVRMEDGALTIGVSDTDVTLGNPVVVIDGFDPTFLQGFLSGITSGLGDLVGRLLDLGAVVAGDFTVPLGTLDTSQLGFPLTIAVDRVGTDASGIGADLSVDLGVPAVGQRAIPTLDQAGPRADLAIAVHEGLLTAVLDSDLLSILDLGTIELPGALGEVLALPLGALPGGEQLPADRTGMCLTLDPGSARTARLKDTLTPMGVITLPDVHALVAVSTADRHCAPWIDASLAVQMDLDLVGTALQPRIEVVDGAVLSYAANGEYDEDEIVGGLGGLVDVATGLLGGSLSIDLGSVLGGVQTGPLGALNPTVLDLDPVFDADGQRVPGLEIVQLSLWD